MATENKFSPKSKNRTATKFLPFISDTSSPIQIFKALVQKSKGYSNKEIFLLFDSLLIDSITNVREKLNKKNLKTTKEIFDYLISLKKQNIYNYELSYWEAVFLIFNFSENENLVDFKEEEKIVFFTVLAVNHKEKLKDLDLDITDENIVKFSDKNFNPKVKSIKNFNLDPNNKLLFSTIAELKAYLACLISLKKPFKFYPVNSNVNNNLSDTYVSAIKKPKTHSKRENENDIPF